MKNTKKAIQVISKLANLGVPEVEIAPFFDESHFQESLSIEKNVSNFFAIFEFIKPTEVAVLFVCSKTMYFKDVFNKVKKGDPSFIKGNVYRADVYGDRLNFYEDEANMLHVVHYEDSDAINNFVRLNSKFLTATLEESDKEEDQVSKTTNDTQLELQEEILSKTNIGIVTCGNCGSVILVRNTDKFVNCPHCDIDLDHCDCPDLYYSGWNQNKEKENVSKTTNDQDLKVYKVTITDTDSYDCIVQAKSSEDAKRIADQIGENAWQSHSNLDREFDAELVKDDCEVTGRIVYG